ncbi:MAG TPA: D-hexose-6-phosphate mutarotase [Candidatus Nanopelagicales bacterium]
MPTTATALPPSVTPEVGRGGLPVLRVATPAVTAELALQGAHLTAWTPAGQERVLWTSQHSAFAPRQPIRGGIPVCFPWFGPGPTAEAGLHGFARTTPWRVTAASETLDGVQLTLTLTDAEVADRAAWPHPFTASLQLSIGQSLGVALAVTNTGPAPVTYAQALHTYLAVGDVRQVQVHGLADLPYLDRLGPGAQPPASEPLRIGGETDRIYPQPGTIQVADPVLGRMITVTSTGSADAVVWNPWVAKAAAMADFGDAEWPELLCVETANVLDHAITLEPGATATMAARYDVTPTP